MKKFKTKEEAAEYFNEVVKPIARALGMWEGCFVRLAGANLPRWDKISFDNHRISDFAISTQVVDQKVIFPTDPAAVPEWLHRRNTEQCDRLALFGVGQETLNLQGTSTGRISGKGENPSNKPKSRLMIEIDLTEVEERVAATYVILSVEDAKRMHKRAIFKDDIRILSAAIDNYTRHA